MGQLSNQDNNTLLSYIVSYQPPTDFDTWFLQNRPLLKGTKLMASFAPPQGDTVLFQKPLSQVEIDGFTIPFVFSV